MRKWTCLSLFLCVFACVVNSRAVIPQEFTAEQVESLWTELWKSKAVNRTVPEIDQLRESDALEGISGKWVVRFGISTNHTTAMIETNGVVTLSGEQDGKSWRNQGKWKLMGGKLVLYLDRDSMPSFIFAKKGRLFIFDPWSETLMSELKREPKSRCDVCGAGFIQGSESEIDADTFDSFSKTFHHYGLHQRAEAYVIRIERAKLTGGPKNEVKLEATILEQINGERKPGTSISFTRVFDSHPKQVENWISSAPNVVWYVLFDEDGTVDAQDPLVLRAFNDDLRRVATQHKALCP